MAAWDRLPEESRAAFDAFAHYYQMPARERSIQAAYRASNPRQDSIGKRASGQWSQWAAQHDWVARAADYDSYLAEQDRLLWEERRRQVKQADWDDGDAMRQVTREALPHARQFIHQQRRVVPARDGQPEQVIITLSFDVVGLSKVLAEASKLQRLASNEPTDNIQLTGAALDAYIAAQMGRLAYGGETSPGDAFEPDDAETDEEPDGDDEPL